MKWILLDIGEVLIRQRDLQRGIKRLEKKFSIDPKIRYDAIWQLVPQMDRGVKTFQAPIDLLNKRMKEKNPSYQPITIQDYFDTLYDSRSFNIQLVNFFKRIKKKANICIFTNNNQANIDKFTVLMDFDSWTHGIISSHTFRTAKPHKKLFQIALQKIHARPQECILIDDKPAYIAIANALGIRTCLYQNNAQTIKEINHWMR